jgi:heterodisulfide reductase subunit A
MRSKSKGASSKEPGVAVVICECGGEISGLLEMETLLKRVKANPSVGLAKVASRPCTGTEIGKIGSAIVKRGLKRFVLAGCSERIFGKFFREHLEPFGINPAFVEFANIKEHCALVHKGSKQSATVKGAKLIDVAVARALSTKHLERIEADVKPVCLVIGAGVAGMSAAVALAAKGVKVIVVEKEPDIGGRLCRLNVVFPAYISAQDFIDQQREHLKDIEVILGAAPAAVRGHVGDFEIELSDGSKIEAGAVIVATGAGLLSPEGIFGYGEIEGVITQMDLEDLLRKGESPGKDIVMIQCAGSRNEERPYCSRICCTASIKNTILIKERHPASKVTILSRGFAEYAGDLDRARDMGVEIIRYSPERPPVVKEGVVEVFDEISEMEAHVPFDRVVLAVPMVPSESTMALAGMLRIPVDQFGFLVEAHLKVRPEEAAPRGIFVAGSAHWPATITESIVQGYGAASRAFELINSGKIVRDAVVVKLNKDFCRGCGRCEEVCRHGAIRLLEGEDGMKQAETVSIQCTGCGVCVSVCPSGALSLDLMTSEGIDSIVRAAIGA